MNTFFLLFSSLFLEMQLTKIISALCSAFGVKNIVKFPFFHQPSERVVCFYHRLISQCITFRHEAYVITFVLMATKIHKRGIKIYVAVRKKERSCCVNSTVNRDEKFFFPTLRPTTIASQIVHATMKTILI